MLSKIFSFGPGEWRLLHNPKTTETYNVHSSREDVICFDLFFGGKVDNTEVKRNDSRHKFPIFTRLIGRKKVDNKEVKRSNLADKFSIFAKLAMMKADGSEYVSSSKLFIIFLFGYS